MKVNKINYTKYVVDDHVINNQQWFWVWINNKYHTLYKQTTISKYRSKNNYILNISQVNCTKFHWWVCNNQSTRFEIHPQSTITIRK